MLSLFTAGALALAVSASATPARRATCTPNAQGAGVSIENLAWGDLEWGVRSTPESGFVLTGESFRGLAAPDFHIQQNGQVPASFIIRDVDNNNLAVTTVGNRLAFEAASNSGNEEAQLFDIVCQTCGTDTTPGNAAGSDCTISARQNGLCVSIGSTAKDPLVFVDCDGSDDHQLLFNIVF